MSAALRSIRRFSFVTPLSNPRLQPRTSAHDPILARVGERVPIVRSMETGRDADAAHGRRAVPGLALLLTPSRSLQSGHQPDSDGPDRHRLATPQRPEHLAPGGRALKIHMAEDASFPSDAFLSRFAGRKRWPSPPLPPTLAAGDGVNAEALIAKHAHLLARYRSRSAVS